MKPKTAEKKVESGYVHTVRSKDMPAIAANIFRGATGDGHPHLYFKLSRSWKSGK